MLLKNAAMKQTQLAHQLASKSVAAQEQRRVLALQEDIAKARTAAQPTDALEVRVRSFLLLLLARCRLLQAEQMLKCIRLCDY